MPRYRSSTWRQELQDELAGPLSEAARQAHEAVSHVTVDLANQQLRVFVDRHLKEMSPHRAAIADAIRSAGATLRPTATHWNLRLDRPPTYLFTWHPDHSAKPLRPFGEPQSILTVPIPIADLDELRQAFNELHCESLKHDVTAGFALGGVACMIYLADLEKNRVMPSTGIMTGAILKQIQSCYHLFPGLNWPGGNGHERFVHWLQQQPEGSSVLLFDTGSVGNAANQIESIVREQAGKGNVRLRSATIVGLVDGRQSSIQSCTVKATNGHAVDVTLRFTHVRRVLHEDCQTLMGYAPAREHGLLHPLLEPIVVRFLDEESRVAQVLASASGAPAIQDVFSRADLYLVEGYSVEAEREALQAAMILQVAYSNERRDLESAVKWGLLAPEEGEDLSRRMAKRYEWAICRYPVAVWDFARKEAVAVNTPNDE